MHHREVSTECAAQNRADGSREHRTTRTRYISSSSSGNGPDDSAGTCPNERSDCYTSLLAELQAHFADSLPVASPVIGNGPDGAVQMTRADHLFLCSSNDETNHPQ